MPTEKCPGCDQDRPNVGPWDGSGPGGHRRLCGPCKIKIFCAGPGPARIKAEFESPEVAAWFEGRNEPS